MPGAVPGWAAEITTPPASLSTPFYDSGKVRVTFDGSEANVCLYWEQGGDPTGGSGRPHPPVRRSSEEAAS